MSLLTITTSVVEFLFDLPTEFTGSNQTPILPSVGISLAESKLLLPVQHKIIQKEQKETCKKGGISLTIMGQRQTYNSTHKPQRSLNEVLGFNQDDHTYRMCNETGIPEFLEMQLPGIPMVVMVTSCPHSLRDPTKQDFLNA